VADHTPKRIACLQPSISSIIDRLGALERVVACTKYCLDVVPALRGSAAIVHDSWSSTAAEIIAAKPDLVIASVPYRQESITEILKSGIPTLLLAPHTLDDIYGDITLIASTLNLCSRGESLITNMQNGIEAVRARCTSHDRPRVHCEEWGKPIIHSQYWVAELVEAAGGDFLGKPGSQTTAEAVAQQNPEVIIAAWCGAADRVPLEKLAGRPGWQQTPAVRNGRVYCINDEFLNTPGPMLIDGLRALAEAITPGSHPDARGLRAMAKSLDTISSSSPA
jgi:iron complex transport system substrate-binding protein